MKVVAYSDTYPDTKNKRLSVKMDTIIHAFLDTTASMHKAIAVANIDVRL
jgi:hypothetical protein